MEKQNDNCISILIIEDHPIFREALRGYVNTRPDRFRVIGDVGTRSEGLRYVQEYVPDIVLLDLGLPEQTEDGIHEGIEAIRMIRDVSPTTQVVVLTAHLRADFVFKAIQAGAVAYLLKDVTGREVIESIERVYNNDPPINPKVARKLWEHFQNPESRIEAPLDKLTGREIEVMRLIAEDKNNQEIAEILNITYSTVKKHVSNTLSKLQLNNRVELMLYYRTQYPS